MVQWLQSVLHCRGHTFDAWSGKILHAMGPGGLSATTTEAHVPRACALQQQRPMQQEAHTSQLESDLHSPQLKEACAQQ